MIEYGSRNPPVVPSLNWQDLINIGRFTPFEYLCRRPPTAFTTLSRPLFPRYPVHGKAHRMLRRNCRVCSKALIVTPFAYNIQSGYIDIRAPTYPSTFESRTNPGEYDVISWTHEGSYMLFANTTYGVH